MSAQASDRVARDLCETATLLLSMRTSLLNRLSVGAFGGEDALVLAAVEKAGALTDRCSLALGGTPVVGSAEDWGNAKLW